MILVTGFGPFQKVMDNPSARLAKALHGREAAGHRIVSEVLPVSFERGPGRALELVHALQPVAAVGFGVAEGRPVAMVERRATAIRRGVDVDGVSLNATVEGPAELRATLDPDAMATALGLTISDDAGTYVCNAWLYEMARYARIPAVFIHIPAAGLDPEIVIDGLDRWAQGSLVS